MPFVYQACGTFGGTIVENQSATTCEGLSMQLFDPRLPACHTSDSPNPETASFGVFYALITVGLYIISGIDRKQTQFDDTFEASKETQTLFDDMSRQPEKGSTGKYSKRPGFFL